MSERIGIHRTDLPRNSIAFSTRNRCKEFVRSDGLVTMCYANLDTNGSCPDWQLHIVNPPTPHE